MKSKVKEKRGVPGKRREAFPEKIESTDGVSDLPKVRADVFRFVEMIARVSGPESSGALLRDRGQHFRGAPLPRRVRRGIPQACYSNAFRLLGSIGVKHYYAEGYAMPSSRFLAVPHAWIVTEDGTVIDPTWPDTEKCAYFGLAFGHDVVSMMVESGWPGVFDNFRLWRQSDALARVVAGIIKVDVQGVVLAVESDEQGVQNSSCNTRSVI